MVGAAYQDGVRNSSVRVRGVGDLSLAALVLARALLLGNPYFPNQRGRVVAQGVPRSRRSLARASHSFRHSPVRTRNCGVSGWGAAIGGRPLLGAARAIPLRRPTDQPRVAGRLSRCPIRSFNALCDVGH